MFTYDCLSIVNTNTIITSLSFNKENNRNTLCHPFTSFICVINFYSFDNHHRLLNTVIPLNTLPYNYNTHRASSSPSSYNHII
jgi:hypothetical protein